MMADNLHIITTFVCPPIPTRKFDWMAYYEGEEELGRYGSGPTEHAAILDLVGVWPKEVEA